MNHRLIAAGIAVVATLASTPAGAATSDVTLRVERFFESQYGVWTLRYSGVISSGATNEYVAVMHQRCGSAFSTAIGGATTTEGGAWEAIPRRGVPPQSGTFRARWKDQLSRPVTLRAPVRILLSKLPGRRYRVRVLADSNLNGRFVALQRLAGGRWTHVRRSRLVAAGQEGYGGGFDATFLVRKRGLRLRIYVPRKTAAPCHDPAASDIFVS
jgi:hypothetical protein